LEKNHSKTGWLKRVFDKNAEELKTWPDWMRSSEAREVIAACAEAKSVRILEIVLEGGNKSITVKRDYGPWGGYIIIDGPTVQEHLRQPQVLDAIAKAFEGLDDTTHPVPIRPNAERIFAAIGWDIG